MKKVISLIFLIYFCTGCLFLFSKLDVDSFYLNRLQEGKVHFQEGKLQEAIDDFRIAEFGLMEERDILLELYFYYSLAYLKLGKYDEAIVIIDKIKTDLNIKDMATIPFPVEIKDDAEIMRVVISKSMGIKDKRSMKERIIQIYHLERIFREALKNLKDKKLNNVKISIDKLEKLNKMDARIAYLKGRMAFVKKKYGRCIDLLTKVSPSLDPLLYNEVNYHLVLSNYFKKNYKQALTFYQKIEDSELRAKLGDIILEIKGKMKKK